MAAAGGTDPWLARLGSPWQAGRSHDTVVHRGKDTNTERT
jgi:hypothetical protein